jgi:spermidine/putrescine transport system permease protein
MSLSDARPTRPFASLSPRWRTVALLVPLLVLDGLVFLVPMCYLVRLSLADRTTGGAFVEGSWSTAGYEYVVETSLVHEIFAFTLGFAVLVTLLAVAVAVVYAYAAWRATGWARTTLLAGAVLSLFTTIVVKLFAVVLVFSPRGVLNDLLTGLGLLAEPLLLVDNLAGAVLAQLYIVVPYAILSVYAVLSTLDDRLVEAARDLGAAGPHVFREVVLPHARPGVAVAGIVSFTWSVGAYPAPLLVGSGSEQTNAILVSQLLLTEFDWPAAAALAVVTVAVVLATLLVGLWRLGDGGELLG